jgi:AcrR family transcriptional regulator
LPETSPRSQTASGRARLLESALAVFAERGYDAASVAEIVARAGLAKSVLYHHFGSKSGLYAGILDAETDRLLATVRAALPSDPGAPRLRAGLDAYLEFLEDHRDVWELFVRDPPLDADARTAHERNRRKRSRALAKLINPAPSDAKGKAAYVDLLIAAARTFTTWWHEHPDVPRDRVLDAITAFADVAAKHLLTD